MDQQPEGTVLVGRDEAHKHINLSIHDICPNGHLLVNFLRAHIASDVQANFEKEVWPRTWVHESRTRISIRLRNDEQDEKGAHYVEIRDLADENRMAFAEVRVIRVTAVGEQQVALYPRLTAAEFVKYFESIYQFLLYRIDWQEPA